MEDKIQINFTKVTPTGVVYSDALHLPADHNFTEEEIEAMKQKRYDDWYAYITNPPELDESQIVDISTPSNNEETPTIENN